MKLFRSTTAREARPSGQSPDRKVFYAALFVCGMSLLLLILEILDYWVVGKYYLSVLSWAEMAAEILVIVAVARGGPLALREMAMRRASTESAQKARSQVEVLFQMTDILQSALGYADANAVVRAAAVQLMPDLGGAMYVFNNSGDRLEFSSSWGIPDGNQPSGFISPSQCWALKRGKPHLNLAGPETLRCEHHDQSLVALEIPMMARGEVYGLLSIHSTDPQAEQRLGEATLVAGALADAMSLALANIALREKLRTQALRDPLTGLYNRRYMEDVLDRYSSLAERNQSPLSVLMIDLDHFKKLNDELGHATGDAVLCEVSATITGAIRPCDVACRYGGEELVVLLPDCGAIEALAKAEILRARIERLSENHSARISASFGVATIPETSARAADVLADADAALYQAKKEGRNRIASAGKPLPPPPAVDLKQAIKAA